jgi:hypothetical protein
VGRSHRWSSHWSSRTCWSHYPQFVRRHLPKLEDVPSLTWRRIRFGVTVVEWLDLYFILQLWQLLLILDLCTRWGWVVSITPRPRLTPGERTPGTHCAGGWVGPRAGLEKEARVKILCPCRGSNPDLPVVQPVVKHYTAWATPARYASIWSRSSELNVSR